MDFDFSTRLPAALPSRRDVLRGLIGVGLPLGLLHALTGGEQRVEAAQPNAFGCLAVGARCKGAGQCCSGVCAKKKGKKRCRAHDTGGCPAGFYPEGNDLPTRSCTSATGDPGVCGTTTGNAGYCGVGDCRVCTKDADCRALCGPQAACVQSPVGCSGLTGTACHGPNGVVCPL